MRLDEMLRFTEILSLTFDSGQKLLEVLLLYVLLHVVAYMLSAILVNPFHHWDSACA